MRFTDVSLISRGRAQVGAVHEAGVVADHLRVARQRVELLHELRARAAVAGGLEDVVQVRDRERRRSTTSRTSSARGVRTRIAASSASGGTIVGEVVAVERGLEHEHERRHHRPHRDHRDVAAAHVLRAPCDRASPGAAITSAISATSANTSAPTTSRSRLVKRRRTACGAGADLRVAGAGAAVVGDRLVPHVAEPPRQRRREPHRDRGADRGREVVDAAARPQPPAHRDRGGRISGFTAIAAPITAPVTARAAAAGSSRYTTAAHTAHTASRATRCRRPSPGPSSRSSIPTSRRARPRSAPAVRAGEAARDRPRRDRRRDAGEHRRDPRAVDACGSRAGRRGTAARSAAVPARRTRRGTARGRGACRAPRRRTCRRRTRDGATTGTTGGARRRQHRERSSAIHAGGNDGREASAAGLRGFVVGEPGSVAVSDIGETVRHRTVRLSPGVSEPGATVAERAAVRDLASNSSSCPTSTRRFWGWPSTSS